MKGYRLHRDKTYAGLMAGLNGRLHFGTLHQSEIVARYYRVNPAELGGSGKTLGHIRVCAETEEPNPALFFRTLGPLFQFIRQLRRTGQTVNTVIQINVVGIHSFEGFLKVQLFLCYRFCARSLCGNEQFFAKLRASGEQFAYFKLAVAPSITMCGIQIGNSPIEGSSKDNQDVETVRPNAERGNIEACLA